VKKTSNNKNNDKQDNSDNDDDNKSNNDNFNNEDKDNDEKDDTDSDYEIFKSIINNKNEKDSSESNTESKKSSNNSELEDFFEVMDPNKIFKDLINKKEKKSVKEEEKQKDDHNEKLYENKLPSNSQESYDDLFTDNKDDTTSIQNKNKKKEKVKGMKKGKGKKKEKEKEMKKKGEILDLTNSDNETISISSDDENVSYNRGSSTIFIDLEEPENSTEYSDQNNIKSTKYDIISDNGEEEQEENRDIIRKSNNKRKVVMLPDQTEYIDLSSSSDESRPVELIEMKSKKRKIYYRKPADSKNSFSVVIPPKNDNIY